MAITAPRGTQDFLPEQTAEWQWLEARIRQICSLYGFGEIRTPMFESTELFLRGIGETTDVVTKEMYTFEDRGGRSMTLRPENTASVVRAFLEHKLYGEPQVHKLYYMGPMFRHDRPQAGRYRQFTQFGVEEIGSKDPAVDAEIIAMAFQLFRELGLTDLVLHLNSVGCPKCRPVYRQKLLDFFADKKDQLCDDCNSRLEKNPLRVLDCKEDGEKMMKMGVPLITDNLCDECKEHFHKVQEYLTAVGIPFTLDPRLVRGLDYYTNTAFEIMYAPLGAQSTVCGGPLRRPHRRSGRSVDAGHRLCHRYGTLAPDLKGTRPHAADGCQKAGLHRRPRRCGEDQGLRTPTGSAPKRLLC